VPNVRVDQAARFHSTFAAPGLMRNTLPPLRSNELLGNRPVQSSRLRIGILSAPVGVEKSRE